MFLLDKLKCAWRGHQWHEGEDTFLTTMGSPGSSFHHGTYVWRCQRCGCQTEKSERPPSDRSWDPEWAKQHNLVPGNGELFYQYRRIVSDTRSQ